MKTVTGKRYLGGFIRDKTTMKEFVHEKIKNWQAKIQLLSAATNFCPHESFSVFTKSVQAEWNFLMRVVPGCDEFLKPLEDSKKNQFISTVTNIYNVSNPQRKLFSLSAKIGGLGIPGPVVKASEHFWAMFQFFSQTIVQAEGLPMFYIFCSSQQRIFGRPFLYPVTFAP